MEHRFVKDHYGWCPCCSSETKFLATEYPLRSSYICYKCYCTPRERHITYVVEKAMPDWREKFIHESSPADRGLSKKLEQEAPNYTKSQFFDDENIDQIDGALNIDLQKQNFADEMFDLVIAQDVFEHLPEPKEAAKEIFRTLKSGGFFIQTTPLLNKFSPTQQWAELVDGEVRFFYEPDYHENPISEEGSPVFWHFGYDLAKRIDQWAGFTTIIVDNVIPEIGCEAEINEVLISYKP